MSGISVVTPATGDPVSLAEAKAHLRVTDGSDDALIVGYLMAARQHVEDFTGRTLSLQTYDYKIDDELCDEIVLPRPPLVSVTSVSYVDINGATQTLSAALYQVDTGILFGRIVPAYQATYPSVRSQPNAVAVRFQAGYSQIPEPIRQAILLLVSHFYDNRQPVLIGAISSELPFSVVALLSPYKVWL
jgi:uncharacterized phiE125 gp8 family phage protein